MKQIKSFPETIIGDDIYLKIPDATDESFLNDFLSLTTRNSDFYDIKIFANNKKDLIDDILFYKDLASKGIKADYTIHLSNNKCIGGITFDSSDKKETMETTYYLDKDYRGKGYVTKALILGELALTNLGFKKNVLYIKKENVKSKNVALKNGYQKEKEKSYDFLLYSKSLSR